MNIINLHDANTNLKLIHEALNAIRAVTLTVEDHPEYANEKDMLIVIRLALDPVIEELESTIEVMTKELTEQNY